MSGVNKLMLLGRLAADPELRTLPNGAKICEFTVVTNDRYTDKSGQPQEETEYTNLTAWANQAEVIGNNKKKGEEIWVVAKKKTSKWETPEGEKRSKIEFHVKEFEFIGNRGKTSESIEEDELPFGA